MQNLNGIETFLFLGFLSLFLFAAAIFAMCLRNTGLCRLRRLRGQFCPDAYPAVLRAQCLRRPDLPKAVCPLPGGTSGKKGARREVWVDHAGLEDELQEHYSYPGPLVPRH